MADDLTTRGVSEPYRMFTSRAEFRLSLRADNADQRLTPRGNAVGCVGPERSIRYRSKQTALDDLRNRLGALSVTPTEAGRHGLAINRDGARRTAYDLLSFPGIGWAELLPIWPELEAVPGKLAEQIAIEAQYAVYLKRQAADAEAHRRDEALVLPAGWDVGAVPGLSNEIKAKLERHGPTTLGQAARIDGMTPAALTLIAVWARRARHDPAA